MWTGTNAGLSEWSGKRILPGITQKHFKDTGIGGFERCWKDLLEVEGHKDIDAALPHSGPGGSAPSHPRSLASGAMLAPVLTKPRRGRAQRCWAITQQQHLQLQRSGLISVPLPRQCSLPASGLAAMYGAPLAFVEL